MAERKDSRHNVPRRVSRLQLPTSASSVSIRQQVDNAFTTVDELDDLDQPPSVAVPRRVSHVSIAPGTRGGGGEGLASGLSRRMSRAPSGGNVNSAFDTVDELDDLDRKYRKASMVNVPSRRESRVASPGAAKEVNANEEYYFKRPCDTTTKVLVTLCIVFFLTTEIMLSVYLMERYKEPPPEMCQSTACINYGRLLKGSINSSANPCTDFYSYSCGNFQKTLPYGDRIRDLDDLVSDELVLRMHDILITLEKDNRTKEDYEKKATQFHQLCMDLNATFAKEQMVHILQNLSWPLLTASSQGSPSLPALLKEAHQHGISALFHISRLPDPLHPRDPFWTIEEGRLQLATSIYDSTELREIYRIFMKDLMGTLRRDIENSIYHQIDPIDESDYRKIVNFEAELAGVSHEPLFYKLTIGEFSTGYPNIAKHYNLVDYFQRLTEDDTELQLTWSNVTSDVSTDTIIILKNRDYFETLNTELGKASERDQAVYLGWRILFHYLKLMEEEPQLWSTIQAFWRSMGSRKMELQARWKKCSQMAIDALPDGGLALYRKIYFSTEQTTKIEALLDKLTERAVDLVGTQEWLSDSDKTQAKAKFGKLSRQLPYSEELYSKNLTNLLYTKGIIKYDSFFKTLRTFQRVRQHFVLAGVYGTPIKFTNLLSFASGADYRLETNKNGLIGVFAKNLVPPYFDMTMPQFAQYSTLGFQFSQELAHVVDYEWFMLTKTSETDGAPSNATFQQYHAILGYLLELYRNTSILLQLPLDSETLYEDSADQAALRLSYRAYQDVIRKANDAVLPGFPFENYDFGQMFFLTFAQYFCLNDESVRIKDLARVGYSHPKVRLTALVQNSEEFDTAFQCGRATSGQQLFQIPDPPRKIKYRPGTTAKQIDEWYHWFDRKPGLPTWSKAW
ncbi:putative Neprilysin-2 [Hypsibius exemplaris]|uniref:Neprilysin-2 n=1 Tax=Hypsibius exemplaris TaxID=2072580 RepID=A0A1W0X864_HYPEX|nr:putative Neprilysin-2 [Hypsibius exemplaris]